MAMHPSHSENRKLVRTFIAVEINRDVSRALGKAIQEVQRAAYGAKVRWVPEENWHLTVKFLGEVDWLRTGIIGKTMQEVAASFDAFDLQVLGLHAFPPHRSPRVIAAGLGDGRERLSEFHSIMDARMQALGAYPERRTYRAHLTLARVRGTQGTQEIWDSLQPFAEQSFGATEINKVILYQSEMEKQGACYTCLATGRLRG